MPSWLSCWVAATQQESHEGMHSRPCAIGICREELIPPVRMIEIRDEDPSGGEAGAREHCGPQHELPSSDAMRAEIPDRSPEDRQESHMLHSSRQPLFVHALVALSTWTCVWEPAPPQQREEAPCVAGTSEMPERHEWHSEPTVPLESPLLEDVEPRCGVPSELAVVQQVECGIVVPVVLHDDVHPRQGKEVGKWVRDVVLEVIRWEGDAVNHVVQDVDVLDGEADLKRAIDCSCHAPGDAICRAKPPRKIIEHDSCALRDEDQSVDVPHVHLLLGADLCEHEGQILRHRVW